MKPLASVHTARGCPCRCSFCAEWKVADGRYLRRSPERVVAELETIEEEWVFFAADVSLVDVERMMRLADLIKGAGIRKRYFLYGGIIPSRAASGGHRGVKISWLALAIGTVGELALRTHGNRRFLPGNSPTVLIWRADRLVCFRDPRAESICSNDRMYNAGKEHLINNCMPALRRTRRA
jgi:hypothetical protein